MPYELCAFGWAGAISLTLGGEQKFILECMARLYDIQMTMLIQTSLGLQAVTHYAGADHSQVGCMTMPGQPRPNCFRQVSIELRAHMRLNSPSN